MKNTPSEPVSAGFYRVGDMDSEVQYRSSSSSRSVRSGNGCAFGPASLSSAAGLDTHRGAYLVRGKGESSRVGKQSHGIFVRVVCYRRLASQAGALGTRPLVLYPYPADPVRSKVWNEEAQSLLAMEAGG